MYNIITKAVMCSCFLRVLYSPCYSLLTALIKRREALKNEEVVIAGASAGTVINEVGLFQLHAK